jgi:hypothetical protein
MTKEGFNGLSLPEVETLISPPTLPERATDSVLLRHCGVPSSGHAQIKLLTFAYA